MTPPPCFSLSTLPASASFGPSTLRAPAFAPMSQTCNFAFEPVLTMPEALLLEYVEQLAEDPDLPLDAFSLASIHLVEELATDHHEGRNYVRALGFRRGRRARVELFVEKDIPPPPFRPLDRDVRWTADESDRWTR